MVHRNPLGKIKAVAIGTIKDPRSTAESVVSRGRGTVLLGRVVVGQVGSRFLRRPEPAPMTSPVPPATPQAPSAPVAQSPTRSATKTVPRPASARPEPEVTPADVAKNIAPKAPTKTTRPPTKAAANKAPAKKSAPGAKLPPRKPTAAE